MTRREKIKNILASGITGPVDSEEVRKAITINLFSLAGLIFILTFAIRSYIVEEYTHSLYLFVILILNFSFPFVLFFTKKVKHVSVLFLAFLLFVSLYLFFSGGESGTGILWTYAYPITALFIAGNRHGNLYLLFYLLMVIIVYFGLPDTLGYKYDNVFMGRYFASYVIVSLLSNVSEYLRNVTYIRMSTISKELKAQQSELIRNNHELQKLSIVAKETDNAISIYDEFGNLEYINKGCEKLFGLSLEETIKTKGRNIREISNNPGMDALLEEIKTSGQARMFDYEKEYDDGTKKWIRSSLTPYFDEFGKYRKLIILDLDITKIKQAEQEIRRKNMHITDSLIYANKIQTAILSDKETFKTITRDYFLLYLPKDIVSGDFYYVNQINKFRYFVVGDCTGHGVPGAFMSILGVSFLRDIIERMQVSNPKEILCKLRQSIVDALKQKDSRASQQDGIDMSVLVYDTKQKKLALSLANSKLLTCCNGETEIYKGNKTSVSYSVKMREFPFYEIPYKSGMRLYMYSDGFIDQFGEKSKEKYKASRFINTIIEMQDEAMDEQKFRLYSAFTKWKGNYDQIDDVCVMGIEL